MIAITISDPPNLAVSPGANPLGENGREHQLHEEAGQQQRDRARQPGKRTPTMASTVLITA